MQKRSTVIMWMVNQRKIALRGSRSDINAEAAFRLVKDSQYEAQNFSTNILDNPNTFATQYVKPARKLFGAPLSVAITLNQAESLASSAQFKQLIETGKQLQNDQVEAFRVRVMLRNGLTRTPLQNELPPGLSVNFLTKRKWTGYNFPGGNQAAFRINGRLIYHPANARWRAGGFPYHTWYVDGNCAPNSLCTGLQDIYVESPEFFWDLAVNVLRDKRFPTIGRVVKAISCQPYFVTVRYEVARHDMIQDVRFYADNQPAGHDNYRVWVKFFGYQSVHRLTGTCDVCGDFGDRQRVALLSYAIFSKLIGINPEPVSLYCPNCMQNRPHANLQVTLSSAGVAVDMATIPNNARSLSLPYLFDKYSIPDTTAIGGRPLKFVGCDISQFNKRREPVHVLYAQRKLRDEVDMEEESEQATPYTYSDLQRRQPPREKRGREPDQDEDEGLDFDDEAEDYVYFSLCDSDPAKKRKVIPAGKMELTSQLSTLYFKAV